MQEVVPSLVSKISKILICKDPLTCTSRGICYLSFDNLVDSMSFHNALKAIEPALNIENREGVVDKRKFSQVRFIYSAKISYFLLYVWWQCLCPIASTRKTNRLPNLWRQANQLIRMHQQLHHQHIRIRTSILWLMCHDWPNTVLVCRCHNSRDRFTDLFLRKFHFVHKIQVRVEFGRTRPLLQILHGLLHCPNH